MDSSCRELVEKQKHFVENKSLQALIILTKVSLKEVIIANNYDNFLEKQTCYYFR